MAAARVAIIGAGMGGLATALCLKHSGREIVLLERDPEPPAIDPDQAFEAWPRPGVPQFRHAHIFLSRLRTLLRDEHPKLHAELLAAGFTLSTLADTLPPGIRDRIEPEPGDDDLLHLWGRRATFEYVLRKHVERLPNVRFVHSVQVVGLVTEADANELRVRGVTFTRDDQREVLEADLLIDASGKQSKVPQWLEEAGVRVQADAHASGFVYACRYYRLRDPNASMSRRDGGGNLDYLGYSAFFAEHGNYALTFGCPHEETELAEVMRSPEGFDALCAQFPVLKHWTEASVPVSKVLGAGKFANRWTRYGVKGGLGLSGLLALGDSHLETNPMYGRGCASAFVQAKVLADVLTETTDPREQARRYYARTKQLLTPYYDISISTDRIYRARAAYLRGESLPFGMRVLGYFYEKAWLPATQTSALVAREFMKAVQMREISSVGLRIAMSLEILKALLLTWLGRSTAPPLEAPLPRARLLADVAATRESTNKGSPHQ